MPALATTVTTTTKEEVKIKPILRTRLLKRLRVYGELRTQLKAIEAAMDKEKAEIGKIREEVGVTSLSLDGYKITQVAPVRKKFYIERLLAMGVTTEMWDECHDNVPGKPYDKISVPGDKEGPTE